MRRKDREIKEIERIFAVVEQCDTVRIAMVDGGRPYVVALNFGYDRRGDELILYLHSAREGRKIEILRKNPDVYFQMDCGGALSPGANGNPCGFSWRFDSVMGSGRAEFLQDDAEKTHALNRLLQHLSGAENTCAFPREMLCGTCVFRVVAETLTGKHHD